MIRTIEAVIDEQGNVRLLEPVHLPSERRALLHDPRGSPFCAHARECAAEPGSACRGLESSRGGRGVGAPEPGAVVLVRFPFSDLSQTKLRPAVVLADADRGDWILCQVTSKPFRTTW